MKRITYDQVWEKVNEHKTKYGGSPYYHYDKCDQLNLGINIMKAIVDCINESCDIVEDIQDNIKKGIEYHLEKGNLKPMDE